MGYLSSYKKQIPSNMKTTKIAAASILALFASISSSFSAIVIDSFSDGAATVRNTFTATLSGFDATASDKLVVMAAAASNINQFFEISSVTYNGVAMNLATKGATASTPFRATGIYYLDISDSTVAGNIVVNYSGSIWGEGFDIGAFALSGTALGFDDGSTTSGRSSTITLAEPDSFVAAVNAFGTSNPPASLTNLGGDTNLGRGYGLIADAGSYTATFTGGDVTSVASFSAIPEPSSAALLGLGGLALIFRRRK